MIFRLLETASPTTQGAGFTLISTMLSVFILSTGITALLQLTISSAINSQYSQNAAMALHHVRTKLEQLSYSVSSSDSAIAASGHETAHYNALILECRWHINTTVSGRLTEIRVSVDWRDVAGPHSIALASAVSNN